jgi:hypothetical protein
MDVAYVSAISALVGSVIGGLTSGYTTWLTQRTQARAEQGAGIYQLSVGVVPESSTWAMMGIGFAALAFAGYRTSRKAVSMAA